MMAAMTRFSPEARELLRFRAAVGDAPLLEGANYLGEEVALFALVQPGLAAPAQLRAFQPIEHEQCALDPPQFLQRQIELVLSAVRGQLRSAIVFKAQGTPTRSKPLCAIEECQQCLGRCCQSLAANARSKVLPT
jgi:hypothetical protein